jgi:hypothetical protein
MTAAVVCGIGLERTLATACSARFCLMAWTSAACGLKLCAGDRKLYWADVVAGKASADSTSKRTASQELTFDSRCAVDR